LKTPTASAKVPTTTAFWAASGSSPSCVAMSSSCTEIPWPVILSIGLRSD
jgi:hypothetical protein